MQDLNISQAQRQYIDDTFFEKYDYTPDDFACLKMSDELHYLLQNHNWDGDNRVLQWIASSPLCSEATALEMFWLAQPQDFVRYPLDKVLKSADDQANFLLLKTIMANYEEGFYAKTDLQFDPTPYFSEAETLTIPASLYEPSTGETPYLYWEADEAAELFGDALKTALMHADRMDLYNIAVLLNIYTLQDNIEQLLSHPNCDRGIAQLVFWRMRSQFPSLNDEVRRAFDVDFVKRWQAGEWIESAIAYDPSADDGVRLPTPISKKAKKPKTAWQIPEIMKKAV